MGWVPAAGRPDGPPDPGTACAGPVCYRVGRGPRRRQPYPGCRAATPGDRAPRAVAARWPGGRVPAAVRRPFVRRVVVVGGSMAPTLLDGDRLVGVAPPWGRVRPAPGDVVVLPDPRRRPDPGQAGGGRRPAAGHRRGAGRRPRRQHRQPRRSARCRWPSLIGRVVYRYGPAGTLPALCPGPGSTIGPDAHPPGRPRPTPRPDLPRRRRRPVARRHPSRCAPSARRPRRRSPTSAA